MSTIDLSLRPPPRLTVRVESFKPYKSNTLVGFADIVITELKLRVRELTIHRSHGRRWAGLPGRPQVDRDGQVRRDDRGRIAYVNVLQFINRDIADTFSDRVIEALIADYPHALDPEVSR